MAVKEPSTVANNIRIGPGIYMAALCSGSSIGYQYHIPACWFSVTDEPVTNSGQATRTMKMIPPPGDGDEVWPNERSLLFSGFHALPHRSDKALQLKNTKVAPSIEMRLDNQGGVHRAALANPAWESLLRWRVYHQGRLVDRSSASNVLLYKPSSGAGNYTVMLVIEGPHGIMPVSNTMTYPLFPEPDGQYAIIPTDTDKDRLPDFLDANPELPATEDFFYILYDDRLTNPAVNQEWLRLWRTWAYSISTDPHGFSEKLGLSEKPTGPTVISK